MVLCTRMSFRLTILQNISNNFFFFCHLDDEEEESSSDSDDSSESDEDASLTSEQLMILKLDENVCPPELEPPTLFDLTYQLRGER